MTPQPPQSRRAEHRMSFLWRMAWLTVFGMASLSVGLVIAERWNSPTPRALGFDLYGLAAMGLYTLFRALGLIRPATISAIVGIACFALFLVGAHG